MVSALVYNDNAFSYVLDVCIGQISLLVGIKLVYTTTNAYQGYRLLALKTFLTYGREPVGRFRLSRAKARSAPNIVEF